jgi:lipopolysaccharide export system permease protein
MKKLDGYILKQFLRSFFFVVIVLVLIICVIDFTEKNDDFIEKQVSGALIWKYYSTFFPYMSSLLTPITVFIATVFVTSKLSAKSEVIAMLASGISFRRLMYPYFLGAIIVAILSFYLNSYVIPDANKFRISFELEYVKKPFYFSERNIHFKIAENDYIYMDRYNNQRDVGYRVTLERIEDEKVLEKLHANSIRWDTASHKWQLVTWQRRQIYDTIEVITKGRQMDTLLNLYPNDFDNKEKLWETLTMGELNDYITLQQSRGADDVQIYQIEKYIRFMQPFTVLVLTFIGLIVSARKTRRGSGFQIALGFFIAFGFIIFFILARAIAEANTLNPILAVWLPNIVFSAVGLLMYHTVPR